MRKTRFFTWLIVLLAVAGVSVIAYPTVSDAVISRRSANAIVSYEEAINDTDDSALEEMLEAARAYNARIMLRSNPYVLDDEELEAYDKLLNISGDGLMGYVNIPSIKVNIPFYHGTNDDVLKTAVGHIEWTSLPVGGEDTHAVLSGHRGLPSAKLFSDLDKVELGDVFTVTVLGQRLSYEVDQILVLLPEEVEELNVIPGGDYCTLLTCTPYGVNTHRLLVRGRRIENAEAEPDVAKGAQESVSMPIRIAAVSIPLLFLFLLAMLMIYSRRLRKQGKDGSGNQSTGRGGKAHDGN